MRLLLHIVMQVSPITGELVAHADMAEHMRISLIDPRWKEQREIMLSRIRCACLWRGFELGARVTGRGRIHPGVSCMG
jgi:splicing factor 3A subunit 1